MTCSCVAGFTNVASIAVPPLKSMPRLSPRVASEPSAISTTTPEMANQRYLRPVMSARQRTFCPEAPISAALLNQRKPESTPSIARVASTAVNIETSTPTASVKAKPLTLPVPAMNSTPAVISVTTLASMIVRKPFV